MKRRDALWKTAVHLLDGAIFAVVLLSLTVSATAQEKVRRVGLLSNGTLVPATAQQSTWRGGLLQALGENGYRPGVNLELVDRYSDGHADRLPGLAREIAAAGIDVVVAVSDVAVRAILTATQATPIVMVVGDDPVAAGFVASMPRPGGNVTGLAFQNFEGDVKRLQLLRETIPDAHRFGRLAPPGQVPARAVELTMGAANRLDVELTMRQVDRLESTQVAAALAAMRADGVAGVLVAASQAWAADGPLVGQIAQEQGLPTICEWEYMARSGCVLAYGHNLAYAHRRAGWYAARILKGTAPVDLPVEQPDEWRLTVNLKAAARLGLTIPPSILARADEVIE
jgi:putative ABC transport system substrate-binding protein